MRIKAFDEPMKMKFVSILQRTTCKTNGWRPDEHELALAAPLPIMYNFWSSMLLGDQSYRGHPFKKHHPCPFNLNTFSDG